MIKLDHWQQASYPGTFCLKLFSLSSHCYVAFFVHFKKVILVFQS